MTALKSNYRLRQDQKYLAIYLEHKDLIADPENQAGAIVEMLRKKNKYRNAASVYYALKRGHELYCRQQN